jgi:hypothetical protein
MKAKEFKELINNISDNEEIKFYILDYEYDKENPQELGRGKFIHIDNDNYINISINK